MTLQEAAARLRCSVSTVRRRIAAGELRASHYGRGMWEIRDEDLDAYLEACVVRPRAQAQERPVVPVQPIGPLRPRRRASGDGRLVIPRSTGRAA
jgi:excisionase family DNA binding protein